MKFHLLWALLALTLLVATSQAQPPACVGDQCVSQNTATSSQVVVVQRSILRSHVFLPRVMEAQPARKLAGVAVRGAAKTTAYMLRFSRKLAGATLKAGRRVAQVSRRVADVTLPPYPRVRARLAGRFGK